MKLFIRKARPDRKIISVEKRGYNFLLEKTILKSNLVERNSTRVKRTQTAAKPRIARLTTKR